MQLTPEQKQALDNGEPVPVVVDQTECVMIRRDVYQRVQNSVELNHEELRSVFALRYQIELKVVRHCSANACERWRTQSERP